MKSVRIVMMVAIALALAVDTTWAKRPDNPDGPRRRRDGDRQGGRSRGSGEMAPNKHEPVPLIQPEGLVDVSRSGRGLRDDGLQIALPRLGDFDLENGKARVRGAT